MTEWKQLFTRLAHVTDEGVDRIRALVADRLGDPRPIVVVPYLTYGTPKRVWLHGRVLYDNGIVPAAVEDRAWHNLVRAYRRFVSSEIAGATVKVRVLEREHRTVTDDEGYFDLDIEPEAELQPSTWHEFTVEASTTAGKATATARVLVPERRPDLLIVSDIDDTLLKTQATSLMRMARNTLLHNATSRLPFAGVRDLYEALRRGPGGEADNPIFYVSNGPWNLFDFLVDFMAINEMPPGPILLRDYGFDGEKFLTDGTHKRRTIEEILAAYPDSPAVLIGDSGEHDPEIYRQVALDHPGRVAAIYIRHVSDETRHGAVNRLTEELRDTGSDMLLVEDSAAAAHHAAASGLIRVAAAEAVSAAVAEVTTTE